MELLSRTDQYASTRRYLRLSHYCDCFDRFCGQGPPAMSIEFPATFAVISIGSFTDSRAPVASRRGKHRWHPALVLPPSTFRCFRETHVASPSTHQPGHRRLRQLLAQHTEASRPTALRRHRRKCGREACRSVDRGGAKPVDDSDWRSLGRNARVPRPADG